MKSVADRADTGQEHEAAGPRRRETPAPAARRSSALMTPRSMTMLQRSAGNAAVAGIVAGRGKAQGARPAGAGPAGGQPSAELDPAPAQAGPDVDLQRAVAGGGTSTAPPVPPPPPNPQGDPKFTAVTGAVKAGGQQLKKHPPAAEEVGKAQAAAKAPPDDKAGQAKAAQVDAMAAAKPQGFDKAAFIAAVKTAIAAAAPKNLDEADKFATSGKADGIKGEVMSKVTTGKDTSARDVKETSAKAPDAAAAKDKPVTPLSDTPPAAAPAVNGAAAMPGPAPAEQVNFAGGPNEVDQRMKDAQVTEQHLEGSNEPQMMDAAAAKKDAEVHAATAPAGIRRNESQVLQTAQTGAGTDATKALGAMAQAKNGALGRIAGTKTDAKTKDEAERARISGEINRIFDKTKDDVTVILNGIDDKVTAAFDTGEAQARSEFTAKHKADMEKYKDERYSGPAGWARWTEDLFTGLPAEAGLVYERAKTLYETRMTVVISGVADLIGTQLDAAKARIARGRQEIKDYIAKQPKDLQKVATEAGKEFSTRFDALDSEVDSKQQSLVDDLAAKYVEARKGIDDEIKAEQEKNKGLVDKAKDAVAGAVDAILKLKALFMGLLAKAAGALTKILDDPVTFIGNFMSAVKQGFLSFAGNIGTHLKKGLLGWLFGALSSAGIELPESFDIKGILKMVAAILGLTWANIKSRIMKIAPWVAKVIDVIESKIEVFTILATQGVAGLWTWIKEKLGDLKEMILTPIKDFVVEKIVTAGISWVLGMLNPAGALVKIVQALIGVVQWIMERGAGLMDFIGTVIDAVSDIAAGGVGAVPAKIEASLAKAVPLVISFLAGLLGLGGISEKIKSILQTVQKPINQAIDAVIKGALKLAKPLLAGLKNLGAKAKAKILGGDESPEGKQQRLDKGVKGGVSLANRFAGKSVGEKILRPMLGAARIRFGLSVLEPVKQGAYWAVHGEVQRMTEPTKVPISDERIEEVRKLRESANNQWTKTKDSLKPLTKKIKDTKNPLKPAELTAAKKAESEFTGYEPTFLAKKNRFDEIRQKKEAPAGEIDDLATFFTEATEKFTAMRTGIEDAAAASLAPSELQAQADPILKRANGTLTSADAGLADAGIQQGLVIPSADQPTPAERVRVARDALKAAVDACPTKVTDAPQLRQIKDLEPLIGRCDKALGDARNEIKAINQVKVQVDAVENVYTNTTNYGEFGDRTSEGAAKQEAKTGKQIGQSWHGGKCRDYERNLAGIISNLQQQRAALPTGVHAMINEAIKRADERRLRLKEGADTWDNRATLYPTIWDDKGVRRTS